MKKIIDSDKKKSPIQEASDFLYCLTPNAWIERALENIDVLLIDHANCEKKAALTAINLTFRYLDNQQLLLKMARLAREEMLHFEQVIKIISNRNIRYTFLPACNYAKKLRNISTTHEPQKLIDNLIIGALIEARSCERFYKLSQYVDDELSKFYRSLLKSESRHFQDYLNLAQDISQKNIDLRIEEFLECEKKAILSYSKEFRFHSGIPL